ncbi:MAG: hypothetical protein Q9161_009104 [Pseudevernia consocians]
MDYRNRVLGTADGTWNLRDGTEFKISNKLTRWSFVAIRNSRAVSARVAHDPILQPSLNVLFQTLKNVGIETKPWQEGKSLYINGPKDKLLAGTFEEAVRGKLELLFVILPEKDTALYNEVKQLADIKSGVSTVCVVGKQDKFYRDNCRQYCANVALKVNLKLGGTNHRLYDPQNMNAKRVAIISENKTMVVGIDVTHPSPGSANPSIAAMVASIDADLAQWPADLQVQIRTRQEMVNLLGEMLRTRLLLWKKHHGIYPENILVYRDGVSESQYDQVLENEFSLMQKACPELYRETEQPLPRFTLIIVGKRHHTRFFPQPYSRAMDKSGNPRCGLVVDRGITEARNWDFFLQSHTSHLGTARPSHYYVLWDEIFTNPSIQSLHPGIPPADLLEQVTYDMCYLYGRATKAVSLCPPVYYADIACERAGRYLADKSYGSESGRSDTEMTDGEREQLRRRLQNGIEVHENLKETMFYI